jgi:hypothetical protein
MRVKTGSPQNIDDHSAANRKCLGETANFGQMQVDLS